MTIEASDIKNGITILYNGEPCQVVYFLHVKPGKGAAILRTKLKNLKNGNTIEQNFSANEKFETAMISRRKVQYSYNAGGTFYFMDLETYESYELSEEQLGFAKNFIVEGHECVLTFHESELIGLDLPDKVELVVTETTDAVKGNTATSATKDAWVETGLLVKVPLFIQQGETIIVSTLDGKYSSRA